PRAPRRRADPRRRHAAEPHLRDAVRPRRHLPPRRRRRRRLRLHRRGGRQPVLVRGGRGSRPRPRAGRRDPAVDDDARRGDAAPRGLQGLQPAADRAALARGRGRPAAPRVDRRPLPVEHRPAHGHPLEGHPRGARGGGRRLRERGGRARGDPRQEPVAGLAGDALLVVANAVATSISTRALSPRLAVAVASIANLVGAFVTTAVASTVGKGIVDTGLANTKTVLAALVGAIAWNLLTWWLGLPSSSSHALIGGLVGAAIVQSGWSGVQWHGLAHKVVIPAFVAPTLAFGVAFVLLVAIFWIFQRMPAAAANRTFRLGQLLSGTFVAFTHGSNDAQKTMGVIALALYTNGSIDHFYIPGWVKV